MTATDSVNIPFPGKVHRHTKPISTTDLVESHDMAIRGCKTECPCRIWHQCSYYNKMKWKKSRGYEDKNMKAIWEYYNNIFRITYDTPIINMNG